MNWIIALVTGLILGWLMEWIIDRLFWRNRRICTKREEELAKSITVLQDENESFRKKVVKLRADLGTSNEHLREITATGKNNQVPTPTKEDSSTKHIRELTRRLDLCKEGRIELERQLTQFKADFEFKQSKRDRERYEREERFQRLKLEMPEDVRLILNYTQLARTQLSDVETAVSLASRYYQNIDSFSIHNAWVAQASLATVDDWNGLAAWQQEELDVQKGRDDLQQLWGIGPKIEKVLNNHGIYLWGQMAAMPADRLTEILRAAGDHYRLSSGRLHDTWPEQARLADLGMMAELKALKAGLSWSKVNKGK